MDIPKISIIVDNYNRSYLLPLIMKAYTWLSSKDIPAEIIIVDDMSTDHFEEYAKLCVEQAEAPITVRAFKVHETTMNSGRVQNIGAKLSTGNILVFNHSDIVPVTPNVIEKILEEHKVRKNLYLTPIMRCTHPDFPIRGAHLPLGCSITRELFFKIGGFDERIIGYGPEDVDFCYRIIHGMNDIGATWHEAQDIVYMHIEQAKIPIRDDYKNKEENEKILLNNERNMTRVVNQDRIWGFSPTLEELKLE